MKEQRVQERARAHSCDGFSRDYLQADYLPAHEDDTHDYFDEHDADVKLGCGIVAAMIPVSHSSHS